MASSAALFIGGGLLEGAGKGLATQAIETGKAKRERALADLKYTRDLDRDKTKLSGQKGLLTQRFDLEKDRPQSPEARVAADIAAKRLPEGFPLRSPVAGNNPLNTLTKIQKLAEQMADADPSSYDPDAPRSIMTGKPQKNLPAWKTNYDRSLNQLLAQSQAGGVQPGTFRQEPPPPPPPVPPPEPGFFESGGGAGRAYDAVTGLFGDDAAAATPQPGQRASKLPAVPKPRPTVDEPGARESRRVPVAEMGLTQIDDLLNSPDAANLSQEQLDAIDARLRALGR